jgi:hypothetical protein
MALLSSGHASSLPHIINDIADALYWLQDVNLLMVLWCTYNVIANNLLHFYIIDEQHRYPFEAHFRWQQLQPIYYFKPFRPMWYC